MNALWLRSDESSDAQKKLLFAYAAFEAALQTHWVSQVVPQWDSYSTLFSALADNGDCPPVLKELATLKCPQHITTNTWMVGWSLLATRSNPAPRDLTAFCQAMTEIESLKANALSGLNPEAAAHAQKLLTQFRTFGKLYSPCFSAPTRASSRLRVAA